MKIVPVTSGNDSSLEITYQYYRALDQELDDVLVENNRLVPMKSYSKIINDAYNRIYIPLDRRIMEFKRLPEQEDQDKDSVYGLGTVDIEKNIHQPTPYFAPHLASYSSLKKARAALGDGGKVRGQVTRTDKKTCFVLTKIIKSREFVWTQRPK
jgi:hypothetical protein